MKSVLISIQPKWCELIASGKKTVEVRKTKPKIATPFKCYIYCTQGKLADLGIIGHAMYEKRMKVIGEFVCDRIGYTGWFRTPSDPLWRDGFDKATCLSQRELYEYSKGRNFYEWHISGLVIYDKPKELSEFSFPKENIDFSYRKRNQYFKGLTRPPQSWCYVEEYTEGGE